jgi:hypothetical protein
LHVTTCIVEKVVTFNQQHTPMSIEQASLAIDLPTDFQAIH